MTDHPTSLKLPLAILLLFFSWGIPKAEGADSQPNFLFIIADDLTFRDLGCYGGQAKTPNIDRFATEGMQFSKCFQSAPMCSPTRHNIYTGLYPVHSGAYPNHTFVKEGTQSVVHYLRPAGYRVALSGKTHIGPSDSFPFEYSKDKNNPDMEAVEQLFRECQAAATPFCLFACSNEPHSPWNKGDASQYPPEDVVLPPYIADTDVVRKDFSNYLAEITYFDSQVGQLLNLLDKYELANNTLVMVVSEQGNAFPFAKWTCYDHGVQSAMLVRWPGRVEAGSQSDAIVEYTDVLPTFVDAAGISDIEGLDGKSFLPVLTGQSRTHKQFSFSEMTTRGINSGSDHYAIRSIRDQRFRLIRNYHPQVTFTNACTNSGYFRSMVAAAEAGDEKAAELVRRYQHRPALELYDCDSDPMQLNNLAEDPEHAETLRMLSTELDAWLAEQGDDPLETEARALLRQGRYKGKSLTQANRLYENRRSNRD